MSPAPDWVVNYSDTQLQGMTLPLLKERCKEHGLRISGNKSELISRLLTKRKEAILGDGLEPLSLAQLKVLCQEVSVRSSGVKNELKERLKKHFAEDKPEPNDKPNDKHIGKKRPPETSDIGHQGEKKPRPLDPIPDTTDYRAEWDAARKFLMTKKEQEAKLLENLQTLREEIRRAVEDEEKKRLAYEKHI